MFRKFGTVAHIDPLSPESTGVNEMQDKLVHAK